MRVQMSFLQPTREGWKRSNHSISRLGVLTLLLVFLVSLSFMSNIYYWKRWGNASPSADEQRLQLPDAPTKNILPPKVAPEANLEKDQWKTHFFSSQCIKFQQQPPGRKRDGLVGTGSRALCYTDASESQSVEYQSEIHGSIDISVSRRLIYIPVMKAASQTFLVVFARRFSGVRIFTKDLPRFLRARGLSLDDFFIFTLVRDPFKMFQSAYTEVNKYAEGNRTRRARFVKIRNLPENEPKRVLACMDDVTNGVITGLAPSHMYPQLWKTQRCLGNDKSALRIDFIGRLENIADDWRYVETVMKIPHVPLPLFHTASPKTRVTKLKFEPASMARISPWGELTRRVCDYYKGDFACFGFNRTLCDT